MTVGVARPLAPWSIVVDCLEPLTDTTIDAVIAAIGQPLAPRRLVFGRYAHNLLEHERALIHARDADILPIVYAPDGPLSDSLGMSLVQRMGRALAPMDPPTGVSLVVDLENEQSAAPDVIAYANAAAEAAIGLAWRPGCYAGAPQVLDSAELYALALEPYWRGGSAKIPEPACSWALVQLPPLDQVVGGQRIDLSASCLDAKLRTFTVWGPPTP